MVKKRLIVYFFLIFALFILTSIFYPNTPTSVSATTFTWPSDGQWTVEIYDGDDGGYTPAGYDILSVYSFSDTNHIFVRITIMSSSAPAYYVEDVFAVIFDTDTDDTDGRVYITEKITIVFFFHLINISLCIVRSFPDGSLHQSSIIYN